MAVYNMIGLSLIFFAHSLWCLNLYDNKFSKGLSECIYFSIAVLSTFLSICFCIIYDGNINQEVARVFLAAFVIVSAAFFSLSNGYFFKKLFLIFTYYIFFCITHNLSYLIASCFASPTEPLYYWVGITIRSAIHFGALIPYVFWMKERILKVRVYDKKQWIPLCAVSILFFCLHSVWLAVGTNVWNYHTYDVVIFLLLLVVTFGLYVIIIYTINYMNACAENDQVKLHSIFLLDQIQNYERSEEKNSQFRHDVRHHLLHMANLIDAGNPKAALDYIEEYDKVVLSLSQKRYCTNAVINNLLSSYGARFQERNIAFSVKCQVNEKLKMKDIDLVSMLGNLLENAMHASEKSTKETKMTAIYLTRNDHHLMIVCENTCDEPLELVDGIPKNKGIGILSILNVCQIYHGQVRYQITNGICSVCIAFPL